MKPIIDCKLARKEALSGNQIPTDIYNTQDLLDIEYVSFDGIVHQGQILVNTKVAKEIQSIFKALLGLEFPIKKVLPISVYDWNDHRSMIDNNSSAFNYRTVAGTNQLSNHAYGLAIDINPAINPYIKIDGTASPAGAIYDVNRPGTILDDSPVVRLFQEHGWSWGGHWRNNKDWQHFEKPGG